MSDPKYFWQVEMPNGDILEVKDKVAREAIAGGVNYIGKLWIGTGSTHMTDGDTRTSVYIADSTQSSGYRVVSAIAGNLVLDEGETAGNPSNEFIFDGTNWQEFGHESLGDLGDFAFVDEGRVTVLNDVTYADPTPAHSSTAATVNITENNSGNLAITGTFTQPSFSQSVTLTGTSTHGTTSTTLDVDATETVPSGKTGYTPAGTVGAPTISLDSAGSTTTIKNPTSKTVVTSVSASAPSSTAATGAVTYMAYDANTETLSFKQLVAATGASISTSNVTVKNGDASYTASAPSFTGTKVYMSTTGSYTNATGTASVSGTVSGTTTGGAYTPKKYQVGVNYDKTTSVAQGTKSTSTATKTVTPYSGT